LVLLQTPAQAINFRSYVSNTGNNQDDCLVVATACASFSRALDQTAAGGEISVLNAGEYGSVTSPVSITKSISITNDGAGEVAAVTLGAGFGSGIVFFIQAGAGDVVSLRGIVIDGLGDGVKGIYATQVSALHIQNCVIKNFQHTDAWGIDFVLSSSGK